LTRIAVRSENETAPAAGKLRGRRNRCSRHRARSGSLVCLLAFWRNI